MVRIQRLRDAGLVESALTPSARRTLVLAGNGHVTRDHGAPRYLGSSAARAISVGFIERRASDNARAGAGAEAEVAQGGYGGVFDWVVVTDPVAREDPCRALGRPVTQPISADANSLALKASRSDTPSPTPMK
jgi:hypothetical protein